MNVRPVGVSSVTVNAAGTTTVGASATAAMLMVEEACLDRLPSETVIVSVRAVVLSRAAV